MKKIGLLCLCLASLSLVGCFHVPDEDWLPSKNKINTGDVQRDEDVENAIDSFIYGIDMISSERNEMKNNENDAIERLDGNVTEVENEVIENQEIADNEIKNEGIVNDEEIVNIENEIQEI